jgi:CHASE3 domain sensor protein
MNAEPSRDVHSVDLRELGISALFAAVVLFVAAMAMLNENVNHLRESFTWVEQARTVQKQIDAVNNRLNGIEMTVRGYALTGDTAFQRRHRTTRGYLVTALRALRNATSDEPALRAEYAKLEMAVASHEALYDTLIVLGPERQSVVAEAITSPQKRRYNQQAIAALDRMEAVALKFMADRHSEAERKAQMTYRLAIGIAVFAFFVGSCGFALALFGRRHAGSDGGGAASR